MSRRGLAVQLLADPLALCRLDPDAPVPAWAAGGAFSSVTRTGGELSVVCAAERVPAGVTASARWRAFRVDGPIDLTAVGIMVALAAPLAEAGVSVFPIATYDTDYLLVREKDVGAAVAALRAAGHEVRA